MQTKWWLIIGGLVACLALVPAAGAVQVSGLYQAEVGAGDLALIRPDGDGGLPAGEAARRELLMRAGLARVLVRLSGTTQVVADPMVRRRLLDRAESFVARYQFLAESTDEPRIRVHFTGQAVRSALWESGWPVWGRYRPSLLVWVASRSDGGLELVSADSHPALFSALQGAAARHGLPLLMPLMDGQDRRRLTGRDLLFEDWERIRAASARYEPQATLLLRLDSAREGEVRAEWLLHRGDEQAALRSRGSSVPAAVAGGMRQLLARLAKDYAVYPGKPVTLEAVVHGIDDLTGFARIERGLTRLAAVASAQPRRVAGGEARFRLAFRGRPEEAGHILELLDLLRQREAPAGEAGAASDPPRLHFTYRP